VFGVFHRLRHGDRRVFALPEWATFAGADWAETILDALVTDRFFAKQGRSIARWTLTREGRSLVVYLKRHYHLPRRHGLLAALFPAGRWSPGWGEHHNLKIATSLGIPVPRVVAAAEYLRPGGHLQSVIAVEELAGMLPLHEAIPLASRRLNAADFARWKRGLIAELVRLTRLLHNDHWFHKDLYLCHFYVPEADTFRPPATWTGRVHMIDFHRLNRHLATSPWWQAKDLGQLLYSSDVDGVTPRDRLRFWMLYTKDRSGWLWFVRRIALLRARNHRGHNDRKPQAPKKAA
jgi:hypothetical protein